MNSAHPNLEEAPSVGRPIDGALSFTRGQHGIERKAIPQRIHVGPVVVKRDAAWIRMADGFEAEPILNLTLLPVDGWQLRGQRGEGRRPLGNGSLQNHPASIAGPVKY